MNAAKSQKNKRNNNESLIYSISKKEEKALATLYDRYKTILFSILMSMLKNRKEAELILQEVFLELWQNPKTFRCLVADMQKKAIERLRLLESNF